ncbi:MAG TPA: flagellar basal body rod protein FlgB [Chloroflexota bacterium]|nr:flagellar basal body rod protein FlgB [Chloroflexota bacterium]
MTDASKMTFSGTDSYLRAAMSGLAARQRAIANNVANVDTPGFKASEVRFEDALKTAISRGTGATVNQTSLNAAASRSTLVDGTSTRADGNNVDIDHEMELLGEANLNYSAMTQVMSTRLGILRNVISGR